MNAIDVIELLEKTSSRNEKIAVLKAYGDRADGLKDACRLAYSPQIRFYTKYAPGAGTSERSNLTLYEVLNSLERCVASRNYTGGDAEAHINYLMQSTSEENGEVLRRVIQKDLKCGINVSTINAVWPGLVPVTDFSLCETDPKNISYPAFSQSKEDGTRVKLIWDGINYVFITRNGNTVETHNVFLDWCISRLGNDKYTLDGELVAVGPNGNRLARKESNGIVNKAVRGTINEEEANTLLFVSWDIENLKTGYAERLAHLDDLVGTGGKVEVIDTRVVNNYEEAKEHFLQARRQGLEGTVLKNRNFIWVGKRTYDQVKFKAEIDGDFKVVGWEEGTGKNQGEIGALLVESECGQVATKVGIFKDMPESVRSEWLKTGLPNVVTIRYNERIQAKGAAKQSLFLPRVVEARFDKDIGNTLEELVEIERSALG